MIPGRPGGYGAAGFVCLPVECAAGLSANIGKNSSIAQRNLPWAQIGKALFVGNQKDGVSLLIELQQYLQYFLGGCFVQISRWLVRKKDGRLVDEGSGNRHSLPLT